MVRRCVQKNTGLEFAAKIINTKKLSARGKVTISLKNHNPFAHKLIFLRFPKTGTGGKDMQEITASKYR